MKTPKKFPQSLLQATRYFSNPDICVEFVASLRWPDGIKCLDCAGHRVSYLTSRRIWKCMNMACQRQFSVKTGSIFEDSPVPLDKWLIAIWLIVSCKNGISSYEIARDLKLTQKTAWFLLHRIRLALKDCNWNKLGADGGPVEVDETFIGPKPQKMHRTRRLKVQDGKPGSNTTIVMGMFDREARKVRAKVIPNVKREVLQTEILKGVEKGSTVYTDGYPGYDNLAAKEYVHETINHVQEYVRGQIHTQGIDNFWSLLKRGLTGTYVCVEPFHLDRYIDEQMFRFNNRATKDNLVDGCRPLCARRLADRRKTIDVCGIDWQGHGGE
jgi:transposase-like protein